MKTLAIASFVTLCAATALAGEKAVSSATLRGMGLPKMQQLSDVDGAAIRGKGPFDARFFSPVPTHGQPSHSPNFNPTISSNFMSHFSSHFPTPGSGGTTPGGSTPGTGTTGTSIPGMGNFNFGGLFGS